MRRGKDGVRSSVAGWAEQSIPGSLDHGSFAVRSDAFSDFPQTPGVVGEAIRLGIAGCVGRMGGVGEVALVLH